MTQTQSPSSNTPATGPDGKASLPLTWEGQTYLVGDEIYLRPLDKDDAKWSMSIRDTIFPLSPELTEEWLTEDMLKARLTQFLGIHRRSDDRVVGVARIDRTRVGGRWLNLFVDPIFGSRGDAWKRDALRMILDWSVIEQQRPVLHARVPADDPIVDAARELGMRETARFRESAFRNGRFVDTVVLEYLNPAWVKTLGDPNEIELVRIGSGQKRPVAASVPLTGDPPKNAIMVGERVYLRPFTQDDAAQFSIWSRREPQSDALFNVGRFPMGKLGKWHVIEAEQKKDFPEWIRFAVVERATDNLVGGNGLLEMDYLNRFGETESFFLPPYREQGYGSDGKHLVLDYAFNRLDLHMVTSWVFFSNTRSAAALRKQGYREAGRINWHYSNNGTFDNWAVFDYLADEWRAMPRVER